jgi:hypothetical protein
MKYIERVRRSPAASPLLDIRLQPFKPTTGIDAVTLPVIGSTRSIFFPRKKYSCWRSDPATMPSASAINADFTITPLLRLSFCAEGASKKTTIPVVLLSSKSISCSHSLQRLACHQPCHVQLRKSFSLPEV